MSGRLLCRLVSLAVTGALAVSANLPPAHGHPATPGHTAVVHRHASLHIVQASSGHARLCDSDGAIIWINGSYLSGSHAPVAHPDLIVDAPLPAAPLVPVGHVASDSDASSIHGPPRGPAGSRAPPALAL